MNGTVIPETEPENGTTGANVTGNVTTAPSRRESKKRYKPKNGTDRREEPQ